MEKDRKEFEETHPGEEFDHSDFFCIEGCYGMLSIFVSQQIIDNDLGLRKLLPRQCEQLAQQRKLQILNTNRSLPDRVKSTIRWTLLPTTDYKYVLRIIFF